MILKTVVVPNERKRSTPKHHDSLPHDIEAENRLAHPDRLVDLHVVWYLSVSLGLTTRCDEKRASRDSLFNAAALCSRCTTDAAKANLLSAKGQRKYSSLNAYVQAKPAAEITTKKSIAVLIYLKYHANAHPAYIKLVHYQVVHVVARELLFLLQAIPPEGRAEAQIDHGTFAQGCGAAVETQNLSFNDATTHASPVAEACRSEWGERATVGLIPKK